jgi:DNA-binding CsgD family transcriptional regulator
MTERSTKRTRAASEFPDGLAQELLDYARGVSDAKTPKDVLDGLHAITSKYLNLNVLVASRFPERATDWKALELGKTVYLHESAPRGWWEEWIRQTPFKPPVDYILARMSLAPHTGTETLKLLEPVGADRWAHELALGYGIRDVFRCPVGGRWLLVFWSANILGKELTDGAKIMIFTAASFAALRLDQLAPFIALPPDGAVTPREIAVLRLLSVGMPYKEVAEHLSIGEETVKTHLKKVQEKLGVRNRTHAVAEALRRHMII